MSEFKVADRVRIKDDAEADGWLQPGEVGKVAAVQEGSLGSGAWGQVLHFDKGDVTSMYYGYEVEPYVPVDHSEAIAALENMLGEASGYWPGDLDRRISDAEAEVERLRERKATHERQHAAILATIAALKGADGAAG